VAQLQTVSVSATIRANALTAVARSVMHQKPAEAAEIARRAYETEPRPFRLKWLAFRLHEACELIEAEAMLDALPPDMKFSDSETQQAARLRREAKEFRLREAKQACGFSEARRKIEKQVTALTEAQAEQAQVATQRQIELDVMRRTLDQKEKEISALAQQHAEQTELAAQRGRELEALEAARTQLEEEKVALAQQHAVQTELAAQRARELEAREVMLKTKEEENVLLLDQLQIVQEELERHHFEAQQAVERIQELEAARTQLEEEKAALAQQHTEQAELAAQRLHQMSELQEQIKSRMAAESDLASRQQGMQEELVRAEAQLDLIKDMLLREPRL